MTARTGDVIEQARAVIAKTQVPPGVAIADAVAQSLHDAGLLRQEPPTRDEIAFAIAARHWDRDSGDVELWRDLTDGEKEAVAENYLTWDAADAVLNLLRGER